MLITIKNIETEARENGERKAKEIVRDDGTTSGAIGHPAQNYYSVAVFFDIDMPVVGEIFKLTVEGETSVINLPDDGLITNKSCIS